MMGRDLSAWRRQIQSVIDGTVDCADFAYKTWYKNGLLDYGLKLRKRPTARSREPFTLPNGNIVHAFHYDISQFEPLFGDGVQKHDVQKYILWKLITFGSESAHATRFRNFTNQRQHHSENPFIHDKKYPSYKKIAPHFSVGKNTKDRYIKPGQDETLFLIADFDCHSSDEQCRNNYAYNLQTFYEAIERHPDIFDGLDYRVAFGFRQAYPGTHAYILFKPDQAVSVPAVVEQFRQFLKQIGCDPKLEVYPNGRLILAPLSPSHAFVADKPHTKQRDKIDALIAVWWDWIESYKLASWSDIKDYLIQHCSLPVLPENYKPPAQPEQSKVRRSSNPETTQIPTIPAFGLPVSPSCKYQSHKYQRNAAIHGSCGDDKLPRRAYERDPSTLFDGDGRNSYLTSMCGLILRRLQIQYSGNAPFEVFERECNIANQTLGKPLSQKEANRVIKSIFKYGNNDYLGSPSFKIHHKRTNPSDLAIVGCNFQRSPEYNKRREHVEQAFYSAAFPYIEPSSDLQYITLDDVVVRVIKFLQAQGINITDDKSLRHMVGSHIRYHYEVKGVKRTIAGKKETVYYGIAFESSPRHSYNLKTGYAIFKHKNTVYRIKANSVQQAEDTFVKKHKRVLSSTCTFGVILVENELPQIATEWRLNVEMRLHLTFYRRYGRTLMNLRE